MHRSTTRRVSSRGLAPPGPITGRRAGARAAGSARSARRLFAAGAVLALAGVTAACGDDDDNDADPPTTTADAAGLSTAACDAMVALTAAFVGDPSTAGPTAESLVDAVPEDLADAAEDVSAAFADGSMDSTEFTAAWATLGDAAFDGCDTEAATDVEGVDYAFEGLPEELPAGRVALRLTNESENGEPHELVLARRLADADLPLEELFALPENELFARIELAGVVFVDEPGGTATAMLDLEPGDYVAVCMIPVGGAEEGEPHAAHGMVQEVEVA